MAIPTGPQDRNAPNAITPTNRLKVMPIIANPLSGGAAPTSGQLYPLGRN